MTSKRACILCWSYACGDSSATIKKHTCNHGMFLNCYRSHPMGVGATIASLT